MQTFTYKGKYGEYPNCFFRVGRYDDQSLRFEIWSNKEGSITTCTVRLPFPLEKDEVHIKNYSENEGLIEFLKDFGVITNIISYRPCGYVSVPRVKLDLNKLKEHTLEEDFKWD